MPYSENPDKVGPALIEVDALGNPVGQDNRDPGMARFLISIIATVLIPLLYPLLTLAIGSLAWALGEVLGVSIAGQDVGPEAVVIVLPCLALFVVGMRLEQRLGEFAPYRWLRNVLRVAAPAAALVMMAGEGSPGDTGRNDALYGGLFAAAIMQVMLWFGSYLRQDWHAMLRLLRLRSSGLPD